MPRLGPIKYYLLKAFALISLLMTTMLGVADNASAINFVVVNNHGIYKQIVNDVKTGLIKKNLSANTTIIEVSQQPRKITNLPANAHFVTIGTQAAAFTYQHYPNQKITSTLLTQSGFEQLSQQTFNLELPSPKTNITALFLDQPLTRLLALGSQLIPQAKKVGVLVGPANKKRLNDIIDTLKKAGLEPQIALLNPDDNPLNIIEPVIRKSDYFVVLADRKLINQSAAKWVLSLSYRYRVPIIAYSQKYVDAGALAAVFYSPSNVASSIVEQLSAPADSNSEDCRTFTVALNDSVARTMGIQLKSESYYADQLKPCMEVTP